jgi:hypothetical protein
MSASSAGASHVIAGYRYQLLQSVWALLGLRDDERLHLEVSEDFTIESATGSTDAQVKHSQAIAGAPGFSLQSSDVRAVLTRFWDASSSGVDRRLVFIARGGAALERGVKFPDGMPGLRYWTMAGQAFACRRGGDSAISLALEFCQRRCAIFLGIVSIVL